MPVSATPTTNPASNSATIISMASTSLGSALRRCSGLLGQALALEGDRLDPSVERPHHVGGEVVGEIAAHRDIAIEQQAAFLRRVDLRDHRLRLVGNAFQRLRTRRFDLTARMRRPLLKRLPARRQRLTLLLVGGIVGLAFERLGFGLERRTLGIDLGLRGLSIGIDLEDDNYLTVDRVAFDSCPRGVRTSVDGSDANVGNIARNSRFTACGTNTYSAMDMGDCRDLLIANNVFERTNIGTSIGVEYSDSVTISGNRFVNCPSMIVAVVDAQRLVVRNNYFDSSSAYCRQNPLLPSR